MVMASTNRDFFQNHTPLFGCRLVLTIIFMAAISILFSTFKPRMAIAASANEKPYYKMALNTDNDICPGILSMYNILLDRAALKAWHSPSTSNGVLTNFAATDPHAFEQIGLAPPSLLEEIRPVEFYSIKLATRQASQVLAKEDWFRGNSPLTAMAVFKEGIQPRLGDGKDAISDPPVQRDDVEWLISVEGLARSQNGGEHIDGSYLLKKWPGFSRLMSNFETNGPHNPLPAIVGGVGVTITPFVSKTGSPYFVYDQYVSIPMAERMKKSSEYSSIVLVQRLGDKGLDDTCYLVLAPGTLSATVESK